MHESFGEGFVSYCDATPNNINNEKWLLPFALINFILYIAAGDALMDILIILLTKKKLKEK